MSDDAKFDKNTILQLRNRPREAAGASVADRKEGERRGQLQKDGRSKRATGRTEQLGVRLRPEMLEAIRQEASRHDIMVVEVIEWAWEAYVKSKQV